ncbi:MAG: sulfatase [Candidatus Solibacter usitatus]|nr:sulfatase [Candidatus Solibacter usitatus]
MDRRRFLASTLAAAFQPPRAARPLNFVFILADDLGWADTGPYGADLHETPNLDRLAGQGMLFTRAYAASPVCTPTRASIMTGKHPARLHMTVWRENSLNPPRDRKLIPPQTEPDLPHSEVTVAEMLRDAGYFTAHIGKWHLGGAAHYPETQGFDVNIGGALWGAPQTYFYPYSGSRNFGGEYRYVPGLHGGKPGEYLTDRLTTEALRTLDLAGSRPFFLNLWHHTVHTPIEGQPALVDKYKARIRPGMKHRNAAYAAMVQSLDDSVGRVMADLDRRGIADRTAVVFTSDNGGYVNPYQGLQVTDNSPLRSGKGSLYEGGLRVPLLVRWPGVTRPGSRCESPVCSTGFMATMAEMAGLRPPPALDGVSLGPLLRGDRPPADQELFFHYPHYYPTTTPAGAVIRGDWKLIEYFEDSHMELYNLKDDLSETRDLAAAKPEIARDLHARLKAWRAEVGAQMPVPNPA